MNEIIFKNIAFVYPCDRKIGRTLISSLIEEISSRDIIVDEYNLINEKNTLDYSILDILFSNREKYDAVFVLDLGNLYDYRINSTLYKCPVVMIAGDDPQNFKTKDDLFSLIKNFYLNKIKKIRNTGTYFYGNSICSKQYDIVFTHHKSLINEYRKYSARNTFWLPYWCDVSYYKKDIEIKPEYDVVTVMTPRLKRIKWLNYLEKNRNFSFKNGIGLYGEESADFYRKGKIAFNKSNHDEITIRILEVLGLGVFLLTDKISSETGLFDIFKPGEHLDTYTGKSSLKKQVNKYLNDDKLRNAISKNGYEEIIKNHTPKKRVDFIFDKINSINIGDCKKKKKVSIHILSFDRLFLFKVTFYSLINSLKHSKIPYEIILFDQNSNENTHNFILKNIKYFDKIVWSEENVGMAKAWKKMLEISNGDYILNLENDWFCNSTNDKWLNNAMEILEKNHDVAFVKLRKLYDRQFGLGSLYHEPWSVKPFFYNVININKLSDGEDYYVTSSKYNCFTFNPTLMNLSFREEFDKYFVDDPLNITPLRSGEDLPSQKWREQSKWKAASLTKGPFVHTGFISKKEFLKYFTLYYIKYQINKIV